MMTRMAGDADMVRMVVVAVVVIAVPGHVITTVPINVAVISAERVWQIDKRMIFKCLVVCTTYKILKDPKYLATHFFLLIVTWFFNER